MRPSRRDIFKLAGGALLLAACADTESEESTCEPAPSEGTGPFGDKVGGDIFDRADIREGRPGVPLTLELDVVDLANGCAALVGAEIVVWQADADGHYSEYGNQSGYDGTGTTFLRGRQITDAQGKVRFLTIYPGWYAGRATHIHVEVLVNGVSRTVTQLAFSEAATAAVYATGVYAAHGANPQANADDLVFFDSLAHQLVHLTGDPAGGYVGTFTLAV